jgi:hypothetical protein
MGASASIIAASGLAALFPEYHLLIMIKSKIYSCQ